jgi:hypothetical protein
MSSGTPRVIDAKVILNDESKMLDLLAALIEVFAKFYADDNFEFDNLDCWREELTKYSDMDKQYAGLPDAALKSALTEEIEILENAAKSITSTSPVGQYWKNTLLKNKYYTEQTLKLVGAGRPAQP